MNNSVSFWDRFAQKYDKPEDISVVNTYDSINMIKKYLTKSHSVLDFGCATGTIAASLAGEAKSVYGIDISPKMIEIAKGRALERGLDNIQFDCTDIMDGDFSAEQFDIIVSFSVLHVLDNAEAAISRINSLLKPGGLFFSLTPCLGEKRVVSGFMRVLAAIRILPYITCYRIADLEKMITGNNFQIMKSVSLDNNPFEHFIISRKKSHENQ